MFKELGSHDNAMRACLRSGNLTGAAEHCEAEAHELAVTDPRKAEQRLQEAIRHYKKAKEHLLGFQLLERHPHLRQSMPAEVGGMYLLHTSSTCIALLLSQK